MVYDLKKEVDSIPEFKVYAKVLDTLVYREGYAIFRLGSKCNGLGIFVNKNMPTRCVFFA